MKFQNVDFNNVDLNLLTYCRKLEHLTIYHCSGLNRSSLPLANSINQNNNRMMLKSLNIGCSPKYSKLPIIILDSPRVKNYV